MRKVNFLLNLNLNLNLLELWQASHIQLPALNLNLNLSLLRDSEEGWGPRRG